MIILWSTASNKLINCNLCFNNENDLSGNGRKKRDEKISPYIKTINEGEIHIQMWKTYKNAENKKKTFVHIIRRIGNWKLKATKLRTIKIWVPTLDKGEQWKIWNNWKEQKG